MPKYIINQNFWNILPDYHTAFITINRFVKYNGAAVMGRGIAAQAKRRYPGIDITLGYMLKHYPYKHLQYLTRDGESNTILGGFVVKQHWMHDADINLITASCKELAEYASKLKGDNNILLNYPGIGNGRLRAAIVQPILDEYLPDNVHVVRRDDVWTVQTEDNKGNIQVVSTPSTVHKQTLQRDNQVSQSIYTTVEPSYLQEIPELTTYDPDYEERI